MTNAAFLGSPKIATRLFTDGRLRYLFAHQAVTRMHLLRRVALMSVENF